MSASDTVENASILSESVAHEGNRLWIGNIDPKITEYHLVKLLERFGKVKQFDFLFHKAGPMEGQPRGYCFVNFHTKEEAERAIQCLNGKLALSKKLVVRWAHTQVKVVRARLVWWRLEGGGLRREVLRGMNAQAIAVPFGFSHNASRRGFDQSWPFYLLTIDLSMVGL
ncbi:probable RNA-binding protein 18 isoform X3 [Hypomesus transpacificus]|uniref:probable RNA-binding protein 18 isoform X3 n=1 Tax=Hypomesus transpacificus TaxID=137520 RepID=UPI001F082353|nr:probable RNA-binding protein 18 isoform X3 [Hypomesus transpacificus]